jgi:uncharacterized protein
MPPAEPRASHVQGIPLLTYAPDAAGPRAVLFFHGLGASSEVHDKEAPSLAAAGLTPILPDAPHHGRRRTALLDEMAQAPAVERHRAFLGIVRQARDEVPMLLEDPEGRSVCFDRCEGSS